MDVVCIPAGFAVVSAHPEPKSHCGIEFFNFSIPSENKYISIAAGKPECGLFKLNIGNKGLLVSVPSLNEVSYFPFVQARCLKCIVTQVLGVEDCAFTIKSIETQMCDRVRTPQTQQKLPQMNKYHCVAVFRSRSHA